jgi:hypothetical protein
MVHGVGPANGSAAFQQSCSVFVPLDELASRTPKPPVNPPEDPVRWSLEPADAEEQPIEILKVTVAKMKNRHVLIH